MRDYTLKSSGHGWKVFRVFKGKLYPWSQAHKQSRNPLEEDKWLQAISTPFPLREVDYPCGFLILLTRADARRWKRTAEYRNPWNRVQKYTIRKVEWRNPLAYVGQYYGSVENRVLVARTMRVIPRTEARA